MKQREKQQQQQQKTQHQTNGYNNDSHNTSSDTTMTASSIDMSDIYNSFDKLSISSNDPNPMMCSTLTQSHNVTFNSDGNGESFGELTDCHATTMSLKKNLSTTEHPLIMHNISVIDRTNSNNDTNQLTDASATKIAQNIELIPDSYNVTDNYVKEHTEIVVLRRKDEQQHDGNNTLPMDINNKIENVQNGNGTKDVERISSFRCSSFSAKTEPPKIPTIPHIDSNGIDKLNRSNDTHEYITNGTAAVMMHFDSNIDQLDSNNATTTMQMIRSKPIITPRPASLSGLFV